MTLVFITLASSVDGYVSGHGARAGLGLGDGFRIFDWLSDHSAANRAIAAYDGSRTGAVVSGRNTYEHADRWGGDSMVPGTPLFVVSRDPIPDAARGTDDRHRRARGGDPPSPGGGRSVREGREARVRRDRDRGAQDWDCSTRS